MFHWVYFGIEKYGIYLRALDLNIHRHVPKFLNTKIVLTSRPLSAANKNRPMNILYQP